MAVPRLPAVAGHRPAPAAARPGPHGPGRAAAGALPAGAPGRPGGFGAPAARWTRRCWPARAGSSRSSTARTAPGRRTGGCARSGIEIEATGTYRHTPAELTFGARVAWRNSARCIGRLYWHSLRVRDRREVTAASDIAAESVMHLREATNDGKIRPVITVFAPDAPGRPGPRILNSELVRYAGHPAADGGVTGDPATAGVTRLARDLGWPGGQPPGRFDILPLIVQAAGSCPTLHELPADAVLEVPIGHPEFGWFADLGLRWYAVPVISDMYLEVGGIRYPAAPFNGWYMCTEIGSRDLGDTARYDQLPVIAAQMGLSTASDRTLWKDKAMHRAQPRRPALLHRRRGHHLRPSHRVGPLPAAPRAGGAAGPGVPGGLVVDRPARRVLRDAGLPPDVLRF